MCLWHCVVRAGVTSHRLLDRSTVNPSGFHFALLLSFRSLPFSTFQRCFFLCVSWCASHSRSMARSPPVIVTSARHGAQPKPNDHIINFEPSNFRSTCFHHWFQMGFLPSAFRPKRNEKSNWIFVIVGGGGGGAVVTCHAEHVDTIKN